MGDVAGATAGAVIGGPTGAALGATLAPGVRTALNRVLDRLAEQRRDHELELLRLAAHFSELPVVDLLAKLKASAAGEELLMRTLRAAAETATMPKLVALGVSLAGSASDAGDIAFETLFVRAMSECDVAHVNLLGSFIRSANELGLGSGQPEFDSPVECLNVTQLELVHPDFVSVLEPLVAVLERHGLVTRLATAAGSLSGGDSRNGTWSITSFGRTALQRMAAVSDIMRWQNTER
jgi:hypothetical protein